mgnify:CR=1 FL=1
MSYGAVSNAANRASDEFLRNNNPNSNPSGGYNNQGGYSNYPGGGATPPPSKQPWGTPNNTNTNNNCMGNNPPLQPPPGGAAPIKNSGPYPNGSPQYGGANQPPNNNQPNNFNNINNNNNRTPDRNDYNKNNSNTGHYNNNANNVNNRGGLDRRYDDDYYDNRQKNLSLEYGKTIKLLRNGDEYYRGQKVVINSRKYRYFDVFLDDISDSLNARFGAVRSIHTPINGHRVNSLEEIQDGRTYVASGGGRFVKLK